MKNFPDVGAEPRCGGKTNGRAGAGAPRGEGSRTPATPRGWRAIDPSRPDATRHRSSPTSQTRSLPGAESHRQGNARSLPASLPRPHRRRQLPKGPLNGTPPHFRHPGQQAPPPQLTSAAGRRRVGCTIKGWVGRLLGSDVPTHSPGRRGLRPRIPCW